MKIFVNNMWCDTKVDWGYNSDELFVDSIFNQLRIAKEALREIKHGDTIGSMRSVAEQVIYHMKEIEANNKRK